MRIATRLDYLRDTRHLLSKQCFSPNQDILMNSIGSAVNVNEVPQDVKRYLEESKKLATRGSKIGNSFKFDQDPQFQALRSKFGRTIDSKAFNDFRIQEKDAPLNVLRCDEATKLLGKLVQDSKNLQRDDLPIEEMAHVVQVQRDWVSRSNLSLEESALMGK